MGLRKFIYGSKKRFSSSNNSSSPPASAEAEAASENLRSVSTRSRERFEIELEQVFKRFDVNGDGLISSEELGTIMSNLGHQIDDDALQNMVKDADSDGDGYINFQEFLEINTKDVDWESTVEDLKDAFSLIDIDNDGYISAEELQRVFMEILGEENSLDDCRRMISAVDSDGNGTVNLDKFVAMMMMGSRLDVPANQTNI